MPHKITDTFYYGRVCEKHPELKGKRRESRRTCPKCDNDRANESKRRKLNRESGR